MPDIDDDGVPTEWARSSYCTSGVCIEVRWSSNTVQVRDSKRSKDPVQDIIVLQPTDWKVFLDHVAAGTVEPGGPIECVHHELGVNFVRGSTVLQFDSAEYEAFRAGVLAGEFRGEPVRR